MMFGRPGVGEIAIIVGIIVLLFGVKRLPEIARSLGRGLTAFKRGKLEGEKELKEMVDG